MYCSGANGVIEKIDYQIEEDTYTLENNKIFEHKVDQLNKILLNPFNMAKMGLLSKNGCPSLLDIETGSICWKAKNVPRDDLDLMVPINDLNGCFGDENCNTLITSTAYSQVRIYDIRKNQKKPVNDYEMKDQVSPLGSVVLSNDGNTIFVGNHMGSVYALDRRNDFKILKKFKEAKGAIVGLALHKKAPYIATASLDRYIRFYNTNSLTLDWSCCILQRLNFCRFSKEDLDVTRVRDVEVDEEEKF